MSSDDLMCLKRHSGIVTAPNHSPRWLADQLREAKDSVDWTDIEPAIDEILGCLASLNKSLRLEHQLPGATISLELAYTVSGIQSLCCKYVILFRRATGNEKVADHMAFSAWKIACAWDAILAGDIDNLEEHLRLEAMAGRLS